MARWSDLLFDDDPVDATLTQSPVPRPDPIARPEPGGVMRAPSVQGPQPRALQQQAPVQAPAAPPVQATPVQPADPGQAWLEMMRRHNVPSGQFSKMVERYYALDRGKPVAPGDVPPEIDADLRAFAQRFPGLGRAPVTPDAPARPQPPASTDSAAPAAPAAPAPQRRWSDEIFDEPERQAPTRAAAPAQPAGDPNAEPDAPTWLGRRVQDIRGKRDPRFRNLPTIAEAMLNEPGNDNLGQALSETGRWMVGASDEDMGRFYSEKLGRRFLGMEKDANGFDIIRYRDPSGREARAYVNAPGLDAQDVTRGVFGAVPFIATGGMVGAATRGAALPARMGAQGLTGAATSLGQDVTGVATGVTELDPLRSAVKAGVAGAGGIAGEAIGAAGSAIYRKIITEPRLFNKATGQLTPAGEDAARAAGVDPAEVTGEFARDFARQAARIPNDPRIALRSAESTEFKIPRTQGELTGRKDQLLREQQLTGGTYGEGAARQMTEFRKAQNEAIERAVIGEDGVAGSIAPGRAGAPPMTKAELGANVRASTNAARLAADAREDAAWAAVPKIEASDESLAQLPDVIARTFQQRGGVVVSSKVTPAAAEMAERLEKFAAGEAPASVSKILPTSPTRDVDAMRRELLTVYKGAATDTDRRAAGALYDAFSDWIHVAAREIGDPEAAARLAAARGISREIAETFVGQRGTAGARIMADILERTDSAEGVINSLFTAGSKEVKNGTETALNMLKRAYDDNLSPEAAKAAWDDLRLAYVLRMVRGKTGEVSGPQAISSAIKNAMNTQTTIARTLLTAEERARMMRLARVLDGVAQRNPNTSWSGVSIGGMLKDMMGALFTMVGGNSIFARAAGNTMFSAAQRGYGTTQAIRATGGGEGAQLPAMLPSYGGAGAGAGSAYGNR